jgi:peptidoglycan-N-acetylglucosamine deacetylase
VARISRLHPASQTLAYGAVAIAVALVFSLSAAGCSGQTRGSSTVTAPRGTTVITPSSGPAATSGSQAASSGAEPGIGTASTSGETTPTGSSAKKTLPADAKVVALTFDDGPNPRWTPKVVAILKAQHVRGTFFMVGQMVNNFGKAGKQVAKAGMLVANHSEAHDDMAKMTDAQVKRDLGDAQDNIERVTGVRPKFFRFPFGSITPRVQRVAEGMGLAVVEWGLDSGDWEKPSTSTLVSRVTRGVKPGTIVLMHDGGGDRSRTVDALPAIITALKAKGYEFVTVDELAPQLLMK